MAHLKGFAAYSVQPAWKDLLAFDGDLKLQHSPTEFLEGNPHFFEVISRENDVVLTASNDDPIGQLKQRVLKNAAAELKKLVGKGAYVAQPEPVVYVYTIEMGSVRMLGILGDLNHLSYDNGEIYPHEETLANKIDIIASITKQSGVFNGFPIIFARFQDQLRDVLNAVAAARAPLIAIEKDAIRHAVYKTTPEQTLEILDCVSKISEAFIADGHHRFKGFSKFIKGLTPEERKLHADDVNFFPVYLVSEDSLQIRKFHRVLKQLNGRSENEVLAGLSQAFVVTPIDLADLDPARPDYFRLVDERVNPRVYGHFSFFFHETRRWFSVVLKSKPEGNPVQTLDLQYLSDHFFRDVLDIPDLSKCNSVCYYPSIVGGSEFVAGLAFGKLSILCNEISLEEVKSVARHGLRMPPKATLFYPKPLLGMLFKMHVRLEGVPST